MNMMTSDIISALIVSGVVAIVGAIYGAYKGIKRGQVTVKETVATGFANIDKAHIRFDGKLDNIDQRISYHEKADEQQFGAITEEQGRQREAIENLRSSTQPRAMS